uniref:Uncharacterized protein n=1 Tax=Rhizophora mucronata TaxID=61149 RepID=A0A2P2MN42_RHIMU
MCAWLMVNNVLACMQQKEYFCQSLLVSSNGGLLFMGIIPSWQQS